MPEPVEVTIERETEYQEESTPVSKRPSVEEFKEIVERHCHKWSVSSVDNLCTVQTQDLIDELSQHFS
jgi:hypothetical protein